MLNPRIVGAWDGTHVWLQWDAEPDRPASSLYEIRLAINNGGPNWGEWMEPRVTSQRAWKAVNLQQFKPGIYVVAEVAGPDGWERARGAKFVRSVCKFSISATRRPVHWPYDERNGGAIFHAVVDGAGCSYMAKEEIEVQVGETIEVELEALSSGPWAQIDNAGDFLLRPALGVTVTNVEPSRNDLELIGVDFAQLTAAKRDGPIALVKV